MRAARAAAGSRGSGGAAKRFRISRVEGDASQPAGGAAKPTLQRRTRLNNTRMALSFSCRVAGCATHSYRVVTRFQFLELTVPHLRIAQHGGMGRDSRGDDLPPVLGNCFPAQRARQQSWQTMVSRVAIGAGASFRDRTGFSMIPITDMLSLHLRAV